MNLEKIETEEEFEFKPCLHTLFCFNFNFIKDYKPF